MQPVTETNCTYKMQKMYFCHRTLRYRAGRFLHDSLQRKHVIGTSQKAPSIPWPVSLIKNPLAPSDFITRDILTPHCLDLLQINIRQFFKASRRACTYLQTKQGRDNATKLHAPPVQGPHSGVKPKVEISTVYLNYYHVKIARRPRLR